MIARNKTGSYRKIDTIRIDIQKEIRDGHIHLRSVIPLEAYPFRLTDRLKHWAHHAPDRVFLGCKDKGTGKWKTLSYSDALKQVISIGQALLDRKISRERPVTILSENSVEHALLGLAALHVGVPYSPLAPAYSLRSTDFDKLKQAIRLLTPGLLFASDASLYERAILAAAPGIEVVSTVNATHLNATPFEELIATKPTSQVEAAFAAIQPDTIAKILFTSGSTGIPKGVINTHKNISTNWQQITQTFPFMREEGLEFIDWLPWNHTYGGNHNFGLALYNGGALYIDEGNPGPEGISVTVQNVSERRPTVYFNVPRGFEQLIPYLQNDAGLRRNFFSDLKMLFYAGASISQHAWDALEQLALEVTGKKIVIATGLGSTETSPSALFASEAGGFAGLIGVPAPGLEIKLVAAGDKLEARYRGDNVFSGYWRQPELTARVFDEEGFYCSGDALRFVDEGDPNKGMTFDGRITEDFKLDTGTWVSVGALRAQLIAAGGGQIEEVVLTGHDKEFIGAIIFVARDDDAVRRTVEVALNELAARSTGSATLIKRALIADFVLQASKGELTDKGSVNQGVVIQNHPGIVAKLYDKQVNESVIVVKMK